MKINLGFQRIKTYYRVLSHILLTFFLATLIISCDVWGPFNNPNDPTGTNYQGTTFVSTPILSPVQGIYNSDLSVLIMDSTSGSTIYYTIDGSTPTTSSTVFVGPISIVGPSTTETIKAIAVKAGLTDSSIASAIYMISYLPVSIPMFSPVGGSYSSDQTVVISDSTSGSTIYYTIDGSTPTTFSTIYSVPISVVGPTNTETIKALAVKAGMANSAIASELYIIAY
jgi:Chitobiase/beta-hexosaminidase C-terminal domain